MTLTVLSDNRALDAGLETEHGLCVHLDAGKIKVLLDTGASDLFIRNASVLGVDLADVDYIFISHGHKDHASGLFHILERNNKAKVLVSSAALKGSFHSSRKGMHDISPVWPFQIPGDRLIVVDHSIDIAGMRVISGLGGPYSLPKADGCLYTRDADGTYVQDDFNHELALQIGSFLFTGCAHNGLLNILESAVGQVNTVIGGFHLPDPELHEDFESEAEIQKMASDMSTKYPHTVFYTGHCTGDKAFMSMKSILKENLLQFHCGMSLKINDNEGRMSDM